MARMYSPVFCYELDEFGRAKKEDTCEWSTALHRVWVASRTRAHLSIAAGVVFDGQLQGVVGKLEVVVDADLFAVIKMVRERRFEEP